MCIRDSIRQKASESEREEASEAVCRAVRLEDWQRCGASLKGFLSRVSEFTIKRNKWFSLYSIRAFF